jgi:hypothetical protein
LNHCLAMTRQIKKEVSDVEHVNHRVNSRGI